MAGLWTFSLSGPSNTLQSIMVVMPLHGKCDVCTERHPDIQKAHRGSLKCAIPPDVVDNNNHVCRVYIECMLIRSSQTGSVFCAPNLYTEESAITTLYDFL